MCVCGRLRCIWAGSKGLSDFKWQVPAGDPLYLSYVEQDNCLNTIKAAHEVLGATGEGPALTIWRLVHAEAIQEKV